MESNQFTPNKASEEQQNQPKASSSKAVSALLVLLAIGVIVVVASSVMKNKDAVVNRNVVSGNISLENVNTTTNTNQPVVIDNTNQPPEVITSNIDTDNWKAYRNDDCKLQTKYPMDWKVGVEVIKSDIVNEMVTRLSVSPIKKRTYQNPNGGTDEIPGVTINCYPKDSVDKVSRSLGFNVMGTTKKVKIGNNTMTLRDGQPEFNPPYGDDRLLEALIDGNKTLLISSWGYDADVFFGVLKTLVLTVDTNKWQTYENKELGFEVKHPRDWHIEKSNLGVIIYSSNYKMGLSVSIEKTNKTLEQFVNDYNNLDTTSKILDKKQVIINNSISATRLTASTSLGIDNTYLYISYSGKNYLVKYYEFDEVHSEIVNSFRLTN